MTSQLQNSSEVSQPATAPQEAIVDFHPKVLGWSAFLFAVLQSVCSAFIALSGVRLLIGVGAFALASGVLKLADRIHIDAIRIPMMILALAGSLLNLVVLWQVWRLRRRPASAWRQVAVSSQKRVSEYLQFALSVLTLLLLVAEVFAHHRLFGNL